MYARLTFTGEVLAWPFPLWGFLSHWLVSSHCPELPGCPLTSALGSLYQWSTEGLTPGPVRRPPRLCSSAHGWLTFWSKVSDCRVNSFDYGPCVFVLTSMLQGFREHKAKYQTISSVRVGVMSVPWTAMFPAQKSTLNGRYSTDVCWTDPQMRNFYWGWSGWGIWKSLKPGLQGNRPVLEEVWSSTRREACRV